MTPESKPPRKIIVRGRPRKDIDPHELVQALVAIAKQWAAEDSGRAPARPPSPDAWGADIEDRQS